MTEEDRDVFFLCRRLLSNSSDVNPIVLFNFGQLDVSETMPSRSEVTCLTPFFTLVGFFKRWPSYFQHQKVLLTENLNTVVRLAVPVPSR